MWESDEEELVIAFVGGWAKDREGRRGARRGFELCLRAPGGGRVES